MALREVLAQFDIQVKTDRLERAAAGIKGAEERLARFGEAVRRFQIGAGQRVEQSFNRLAVGAVAAAYGISKLVTGTVEAANQLRNSADELGVTTDELQRYEFAAEATGVKTKEVALAFRYLERSMSGISAASQGSSKALTKLHIKATDATGKVRPLWDVLGDLADRMKKDPGRAVGMAMSVLGRGGASLVPILKQGRTGLDALKSSFDATSMGLRGDFLESAKRAQLDLTRLKFSFLTVRAAVAEGLFPWLHLLADLMVRAGHLFEWLREHTYAFTTALMALGAAGTVAGIWRIVQAVEVLGVAFGVTFSEALLTILPVLAVLGLLYLAFDDIYTFVNGGDSLIGRWLDGTYGPGASKRFLTETKHLIDDVETALEPIVGTAKAAGHALAQAFTGILPTAIRNIAKGVILLVMAIDAMVSGLKQAKHLLGFAWKKITGDDDAAADENAAGATESNALDARFRDYNDALDTLNGNRAPTGTPELEPDDDRHIVHPPPGEPPGKAGKPGPIAPAVRPAMPFSETKPGAAPPGTFYRMPKAAPNGVPLPPKPKAKAPPKPKAKPVVPVAGPKPAIPPKPYVMPPPGTPSAASPSPPSLPPPPPPPVQVTVTQTFNNPPGKPDAVRRATQQGVSDGMRQANGGYEDAYAGVQR